MMDKDYLIELITKRLTGSISSEESKELDQLLSSNTESRAIFENLQSKWTQAEGYKADIPVDTDKSWYRFVERSKTSSSTTTRYLIPTWVRIAALLVLGIGIGFYLVNNDSGVIQFATSTNERKEISLPDGTHVWLNASSKLSYTDDFLNTGRTVTLTGGAYFDVVRNEKKPFTVVGKHTRIQVLGTSFEVNDYAENEFVKVEVQTGKVAFKSNKEDSQVILERGMYGLYDLKSNKLESQISESSNFNAWVTETLEFKDAPMAQVVKDLESYFKVKIEISNANLASCKFTGTFNKPVLEDILEVLSISLNVTVTQNNNRYTLRGKGCVN